METNNDCLNQSIFLTIKLIRITYKSKNINFHAWNKIIDML